MQTDEELITLCLERDARAWETLVRRYQDRMLNLAYQFTWNREEARDLAQEIFVRLYQSLHHFDPARSFRVWFFSLARNLCIDQYRRRRKDRLLSNTPVEEYRDLPAKAEPTDQALLVRERREILSRALDALGSLSREAIVMKDLQELSHEEMARLLEVPVGTVKSRVARARIELARALVRVERRGEPREVRDGV